MIIRNDTRLDANNLVLTGWFSGLDTTGNLGTPVKIRSAISFGNRFDLVIEEDGGAGALADDNGVDELAIFLDGGGRNTNPNLVACHDPKTPQPWPDAALTAGVRTPPKDGFFDDTATFIGTFKDANDDWMAGRSRFDDK